MKGNNTIACYLEIEIGARPVTWVMMGIFFRGMGIPGRVVEAS